MKILILSDLHIENHYTLGYVLCYINDNINPEDYDTVVISGDIFESSYQKDYYKALHEMFNGKPVICCLGNHEFFHRDHNKVIEHYRELYNPEKYDVHYLDVVDSVTIDEVNFVGNFLGYDGSLGFKDQVMEDWAKFGWMDYTIKSFYNKGYLNFYNENREKILNSIEENCSPILVMVTHTVPHADLNLHMSKESSLNAYSGVDNFLKDCDVDYSICGHTHLKVIGKTIEDIDCVNVGSDYSNIQYYILDI